jgi:hypothetical protein
MRQVCCAAAGALHASVHQSVWQALLDTPAESLHLHWWQSVPRRQCVRLQCQLWCKLCKCGCVPMLAGSSSSMHVCVSWVRFSRCAYRQTCIPHCCCCRNTACFGCGSCMHARTLKCKGRAVLQCRCSRSSSGSVTGHTHAVSQLPGCLVGLSEVCCSRRLP